jgi:hypothetical protein
VVPLVFKTSLGIVRSPEGSTPSLLRQESRNIVTTQQRTIQSSGSNLRSLAASKLFAYHAGFLREKSIWQLVPDKGGHPLGLGVMKVQSGQGKVKRDLAFF